MSAPFDDVMFTLTPGLTVGTGHSAFVVPAAQRRAGDNGKITQLPAGNHQINVTWKGPVGARLAYRDNGRSTAVTLAMLPGTVNATAQMTSVAVPAAGGFFWFEALRDITEADMSASTVTLSCTVFLNEARKPLT